MVFFTEGRVSKMYSWRVIFLLGTGIGLPMFTAVTRSSVTDKQCSRKNQVYEMICKEECSAGKCSDPQTKYVLDAFLNLMFGKSVGSCKQICGQNFDYAFVPEQGIASCYWFSPEERLSRDRAKEHCERLGGHLVSIETKEEMDHLSKIIQRALTPWYKFETLMIFEFCWTSGSDHEEEGRWIWESTGEPFNFTKWTKFDTPDNDHADVMGIRLISRFWDDVSPTHLGLPLCEKKSK